MQMDGDTDKHDLPYTHTHAVQGVHNSFSISLTIQAICAFLTMDIYMGLWKQRAPVLQG
jgi:hypothetical protein